MLNAYDRYQDNWVIVRVWLPKDDKGKFITAHEALTGKGDVGHASLQTKKHYASLWPVKDVGMFRGLFGQVNGVFINNAKTDIILESWGHLDKPQRLQVLKLAKITNFERSEVGNLDFVLQFNQAHAKDIDEILQYLESQKIKKAPDVIVVLNTLSAVKINMAFRNYRSSHHPDALKWSAMGQNIFNWLNNDGGQSCSGLVYHLLNAGEANNLAAWDIVSSWWAVSPDAVARFITYAVNSKQESEERTLMRIPGELKKQGIIKWVDLPQWVKKPEDLNPHKNAIGKWLGACGPKK